MHWRSLLLFFVASFVLHLLWELLQSPFYDCFSIGSLLACFLICLRAAATGDLLFMLILYLALAVIHRKFFWLTERAAYTHPATWVLPPLLGSLLAVSLELWAVHVAHRWQYAGMPLLPVMEVGLLPVAQMIVIPLIVPLMCRRIVGRLYIVIAGQRSPIADPDR